MRKRDDRLAELQEKVQALKEDLAALRVLTSSQEREAQNLEDALAQQKASAEDRQKLLEVQEKVQEEEMARREAEHQAEVGRLQVLHPQPCCALEPPEP